MFWFVSLNASSHLRFRFFFPFLQGTAGRQLLHGLGAEGDAGARALLCPVHHPHQVRHPLPDCTGGGRGEDAGYCRTRETARKSRGQGSCILCRFNVSASVNVHLYSTAYFWLHIYTKNTCLWCFAKMERERERGKEMDTETDREREVRDCEKDFPDAVWKSSPKCCWHWCWHAPCVRDDQVVIYPIEVLVVLTCPVLCC